MVNVYSREKAFSTVPETVKNLKIPKTKTLQPSKWARIAYHSAPGPYITRRVCVVIRFDRIE
jgi:hypothetical protein